MSACLRAYPQRGKPSGNVLDQVCGREWNERSTRRRRREGRPAGPTPSHSFLVGKPDVRRAKSPTKTKTKNENKRGCEEKIYSARESPQHENTPGTRNSLTDRGGGGGGGESPFLRIRRDLLPTPCHRSKQDAGDIYQSEAGRVSNNMKARSGSPPRRVDRPSHQLSFPYLPRNFGRCPRR